MVKVPQIEPVDRESYLEDLWDKSYDELVAYKNHFGNCNIPISYDANPSLGAWAFSQRMAYKKGKLSDDRIEKLTELGFSFGYLRKLERVKKFEKKTVHEVGINNVSQLLLLIWGKGVHYLF